MSTLPADELEAWALAHAPGWTRRDDLDAIDAVSASYDRGQPIDNLESAALPNKQRCIEGLTELLPVLYMGFYATRALNRDNLRHAIAERMYRAHDLLVEQIERALTYQNWDGRCEDCPPPGSGEDIVLRLFAAIPEIRRVLNSDLEAAFEGDPAADSIEEIVFSSHYGVAVLPGVGENSHCITAEPSA